MRHIIWDWNGTLLADQCVVLSSVNSALAAVGCRPVAMSTYRRASKRPVRPFYDTIAGRPLGNDEWETVDQVYHRAYAERVHEAALAPDATEVLRGAASHGVSQSLLSMWPHRDLVPLVGSHALMSWFCRVDGYRGECGGSKAEHMAEHVAALGKDHGPAPGDLLVVGDTVDDAVAARMSGVSCILLAVGSYERDILERQDVPVAGSLTEALTIAGCGDRD